MKHLFCIMAVLGVSVVALAGEDDVTDAVLPLLGSGRVMETRDGYYFDRDDGTTVRVTRTRDGAIVDDRSSGASWRVEKTRDGLVVRETMPARRRTRLR